MSDIVTLNGYKIKDEKAVRSYETIALMKADTKLKEGYHVKTKGYYQANDGGHGEYVIIDDDTLVEDGGSIHILTNGLRAKLITNDFVKVKQFGAKGNGTNDDTNYIQSAINYCIENNKTLLVNSTSNFYKITKPLKVLVKKDVNGYWAGNGLTINGESKSNCRIVKIGNYVYTEESETEFNSKNCTLICIHSSDDTKSGTGITLNNLTLENYINDELEFDNTGYGLYTNVSRSTYQNLNIKAYHGINAKCFSSLFENIYYMVTESCLYLRSGTSNTFRFMYCSGVLNPYDISSSYSSLINVCCDDCKGTLFTLGGMGLTLLSCGTESPKAQYIFKALNHFTTLLIENFYMFRQTGDSENSLSLNDCAILYSEYAITVHINNISIVEFEHVTEDSYIFDIPGVGTTTIGTKISNIRYYKNYTGDDNERILLWKNKPQAIASQQLDSQTHNFNYFMTTNKKIYPYIGGYYNTDATNQSQGNAINSANISASKSIWLDCKDKYHNENDEDIRYTGRHKEGDIQLFNHPKTMNSLGLSITDVTNEYTWSTHYIPIVLADSTANRPTNNLFIGLQYFDTTLNKPIWYNGSNWVDSTGTTV